MKAYYQINENCNEAKRLPISLQITMTLDEWRKFAEDLRREDAGNPRPATAAFQTLVERFVANAHRKLYAPVEMGPYFEREVKIKEEETE